MEWKSEERYHMNALMTLLPVTLSVPAMRRERPVVAWDKDVILKFSTRLQKCGSAES